MNCTECGSKCVKISATEAECPDCCNSFVKRGRHWEPADAHCIDCGRVGRATGHQDCQYPQDH